MAGNIPQRHPDVDVLIDEIDMLFDQQLTNAITGLLQSAAPDLYGCFCDDHTSTGGDCFYAPCSDDCDCEDADIKKIEPLSQISGMVYVPSWVTIENGEIIELEIPYNPLGSPRIKQSIETLKQTQMLRGNSPPNRDHPCLRR